MLAYSLKDVTQRRVIESTNGFLWEWLVVILT